MNAKDGLFRQRVGALIEIKVCDKFGLFYNKRQTTFGYYDAYKNGDLFEIKASSLNYNTFIIRLRNHERLLKAKGSYIFVSYSLVNKDKDLRVISDILIENIYIISTLNMDKILKKYGTVTHKRSKKDKQLIKIQLIKIQLSNVLKAKGIKMEV
jgi:hypothetical protein